MPAEPPARVSDLLLTTRGLVFLSSSGGPLPDDTVRAVELELASLGYVLSSRLSRRLANCALAEVVEFRAWAFDVLNAHVGGNRRHEPLFRNFPDDVPDDTARLWWQKVLVHFLQAEQQPCLFCWPRGHRACAQSLPARDLRALF